MALALALLNALFFAALGGHIAAGGAYEGRTVAAMALRTALWIAIAALALRQKGSFGRRGQAPLSAMLNKGSGPF